MSTIDDMPRVMGEDGEFHAQDEAVDLSGTPIEAWVALGFFWLLAVTVFYQFFTRYVLNNSASWTEEIARYLLIATVFTGATIGVATGPGPTALMRTPSVAHSKAKDFTMPLRPALEAAYAAPRACPTKPI